MSRTKNLSRTTTGYLLVGLEKTNSFVTTPDFNTQTKKISKFSFVLDYHQ